MEVEVVLALGTVVEPLSSAVVVIEVVVVLGTMLLQRSCLQCIEQIELSFSMTSPSFPPGRGSPAL